MRGQGPAPPQRRQDAVVRAEHRRAATVGSMTEMDVRAGRRPMVVARCTSGLARASTVEYESRPSTPHPRLRRNAPIAGAGRPAAWPPRPAAGRCGCSQNLPVVAAARLGRGRVAAPARSKVAGAETAADHPSRMPPADRCGDREPGPASPRESVGLAFHDLRSERDARSSGATPGRTGPRSDAERRHRTRSPGRRRRRGVRCATRPDVGSTPPPRAPPPRGSAQPRRKALIRRAGGPRGSRWWAGTVPVAG